MEIIHEPDLGALTTLGLGGKALALVRPSTCEDLANLQDVCTSFGGTPYVLGRGSNILARDGHLPYVLVQADFKAKPMILKETQDQAWVKVGAGVSLPKFVKYCASEGLAGLEGLVGIPGSVGGAVAMNAGSFGSETCAAVTELEIWQESQLKTLTPKDFSYAYRAFILRAAPENFLILNVTFGLRKAERHCIFRTMDLNFLNKKSRQPITARSAGCVFKNPPAGPSAGYLLEAAGFKGKSLGGVAFSNLHANFLLNVDHGTSSEALTLIEAAKEKVLQLFQVQLEPEVRII
ncbi:MAG: UDP-N-acetylmuramate dehydrogenase [Desulfovibrionaceae bacterium]|nr:UDP-N-acetylmuramate dehydrogenase [Desulfovibrionaceae bacterium]